MIDVAMVMVIQQEQKLMRKMGNFLSNLIPDQLAVP